MLFCCSRSVIVLQAVSHCPLFSLSFRHSPFPPYPFRCCPLSLSLSEIALFRYRRSAIVLKAFRYCPLPRARVVVVFCHHCRASSLPRASRDCSLHSMSFCYCPGSVPLLSPSVAFVPLLSSFVVVVTLSPLPVVSQAAKSCASLLLYDCLRGCWSSHGRSHHCNCYR